jgi:hypothetical protein
MEIYSIPSELPVEQQVQTHLNYLVSNDPSIRFHAANSLKNIFNASSSIKISIETTNTAISRMVAALVLEDNPTCDRIIWALECIGENALRALILATRSEIHNIQTRAIYALGEYISSPRLRLESLAVLLKSDIFVLRQASAHSINCFAQKIGMTQKCHPEKITIEHSMIHEKLKYLLIENLKNDELNISQSTQQALDWLEGRW